MRLKVTRIYCGIVSASLLCFAATTSAEATRPPNVVGKWRVYSARIDYDAGGSSVSQPLSSRKLIISPSGKWTYGSSSGRWSVRTITTSNWTAWHTKPYGPTLKIVLSGWAGGAGQGPLEVSGGRVNFLWVMYHASPPTVAAAGRVQLKFGH